MRIAFDDRKLDRLVVVYPGERRYALADRVEVVPFVDLVGAGGDAASLFKKQRRSLPQTVSSPASMICPMS